MPKEFRRYSQMNLYLFGLLVEQLETQFMFFNDSNNRESQIPMDRQLGW